MNILMRLNLGIILLLLCLGCSEDSPTESTDNQQPFIKEKTYSNPQIGLIMTFPDDWAMQMNLQIGEYNVLLFAEKQVALADKPNISLISQAMDSKVGMDLILNGVAEQMPYLLENVVISEKKVVMLNGYECGEITYTFTEQSDTYKQKQLYYYNKTFLIIISYLAKPDIFDTYYSDLYTIQNSIVLTE